jgi:hypothetical protein
MTYLLKARTVEPEKEILPGNGCVTLKNGVTIGSGVFCVVRSDTVYRGSAGTRLAKVVCAKFAARPRVCAALCETTKQTANLSAHQNGGRPSSGIAEILETETSIAEIRMSCHHE